MIKWGAGFYHAYKENCPPNTDGRTISLRCPNCGIHTNAEIISRFITEQNDFVRLPTEMSVYNFFLKCTRCKSSILVLWSYGKDEFKGIGYTCGRIVFPIYTEAFETEKFKIDAVPKAIFEDIAQAELAYYAGAYLGSGLLLRRACQNICRDKKCKEDGLVGQIKELVTKGIITQDMAELADTIRVIGNELAHPDPNTPFVITEDDVKNTREFINQLTQIIYINPYKSKHIKEELRKKGVK